MTDERTETLETGASAGVVSANGDQLETHRDSSSMNGSETPATRSDTGSVDDSRSARPSRNARRGRQGKGDGRNRPQSQQRGADEQQIPPRPSGPPLIVAELEYMPIEGLHEFAREYELQGYTRMTQPDLIIRLLQARTERDGLIFGDGILEIIEDEGWASLIKRMEDKVAEGKKSEKKKK